METFFTVRMMIFDNTWYLRRFQYSGGGEDVNSLMPQSQYGVRRFIGQDRLLSCRSPAGVRQMPLFFAEIGRASCRERV